MPICGLHQRRTSSLEQCERRLFNLATRRPQWLALRPLAPDLWSTCSVSSPAHCATCFTVRKKFTFNPVAAEWRRANIFKLCLHSHNCLCGSQSQQPQYWGKPEGCVCSSLPCDSSFWGFFQHLPEDKIFLHLVTQRYHSFYYQDKRRGKLCCQSLCFFWVFHPELLHRQPVGGWLSDYHKGLKQPSAHPFDFLSTGGAENQSFFKSFFFISIGDKQKEEFNEKNKKKKKQPQAFSMQCRKPKSSNWFQAKQKSNVTFTNARDFAITLCFVFLYSDQVTAGTLSLQVHMSMAPLSSMISTAWNKLVLVCDAAVHSMGGDQQQMMWHLP